MGVSEWLTNLVDEFSQRQSQESVDERATRLRLRIEQLGSAIESAGTSEQRIELEAAKQRSLDSLDLMGKLL